VLAFAPHSGWAAVVVIDGSPAEPQVLLRNRVDMADPHLQGSKQPYHEIEGLPLLEAAKRLERFRSTAKVMACEAIRALLESIGRSEREPRVAGILDSSGRQGDTLAATLASHALIHTADGNHFREALEGGCRQFGISVTRVRQADLVGRAASVLRKPAAKLEATIQALGREIGPPWGADQKSAALLAWLLLAAARG
jgi:hypothetical protein